MRAKSKLRYDTELLLADADMKEIAQEIGIKIEQDRGLSGKAGILCPNPDHPDRQFGNCFIKQDNTYTCYSCGDSGDVFHLVMQFLGVSFPKALGIVADICGGRNHYLLNTDASDDDFQHVLNQRECDLIGLCNSSVYGVMSIGTETGDVQPGMRKRLIDWDQTNEPIYILEKCLDPNPLLTLMKEDRAWYRELVLQKIEEALCDRREIVNRMAELQGGELFIPGYCDEIEKIEDILIKHFPDENYTRKVLENAYANNGKKAMIVSILSVKPVASPF